MSKNKSRNMQKMVRLLDQCLAIEEAENNSAPGSVLRLIKQARKALLKDIRKRRESRDRFEKRGSHLDRRL